MGRRERERELARKRTRKVKLKKLRARFAAAKTDAERQLIVDKVARLSPFVVLEQPAS
jgi:hypothetical protein